MHDLVIIGAGGFGREVIDLVEAVNSDSSQWNLIGVLDDGVDPDPQGRLDRRGVAVLGKVADIVELPASTRAVVAIGSSHVRQALVRRPEMLGRRFARLTHPTANVSRTAVVADGTLICGHVDVGADTVVGTHVHLDRAVQVGHDTVLEDLVTLHPAAIISGGCRLATGVEVGTNATVLPGRSIGQAAIVGAAACVVRDVDAGSVVRGVPAR